MSAPVPSLQLGAAPVRILGVGTAFPATSVPSDVLLDALAPGLPSRRRAALLGFVHHELGVHHRAHVAGEERAWTLAVEAARQAIEAADRPAIVAHVHATSTPSRWTGPDVARIGQALGLRAAQIDLRGGCTGGLWALVQGARLCVEAGAAVLVTVADAMSLTFPQASADGGGERMLPLALGDGSAALVIAPASAGGLVRAVLGGDPSHADLSTVLRELPHGDGPFTLGGDPQAFADATRAALESAVHALRAPVGLPWIVHGRADTARALCDAPWLHTLAAHGMLGVASLPTALIELAASGHTGPVALATAGGGLGYGAAIWELA